MTVVVYHGGPRDGFVEDLEIVPANDTLVVAMVNSSRFARSDLDDPEALVPFRSLPYRYENQDIYGRRHYRYDGPSAWAVHYNGYRLDDVQYETKGEAHQALRKLLREGHLYADPLTFSVEWEYPES